MEQYRETFQINCPSLETSESLGFLARKRLQQLRLQDFPKMNIKDHDHAKVLLEHIRLSLKYEHKSPVRREVVRTRNITRGVPIKFEDEGEESSKGGSSLPPLKGVVEADAKAAKKSKGAISNYPSKKGKQRRRSFDNDAWQAISNLRTAQEKTSAATQHIRDGFFPAAEDATEDDKKRRERSRRWTLETDEPEKETAKQKWDRYGNMALEFDIMQKEMQILQKEQINYFRDIIGCEHGNIQFLNDITNELLFYHDKKWHRHSANSGFAGVNNG